MVEIVNLRRARKDRAKAAKDARAAENRSKFGRGKAEKRATGAERERTEIALDGKRLAEEPDSEAPPEGKR